MDFGIAGTSGSQSVFSLGIVYDDLYGDDSLFGFLVGGDFFADGVNFGGVGIEFILFGTEANGFACFHKLDIFLANFDVGDQLLEVGDCHQSGGLGSVGFD